MSEHLRKLAAVLTAALSFVASAAPAHAEGCRLIRALSIPLIGPATSPPLVSVAVNGKPASFMVDTGGAWGFLSSTLAAGLPTSSLPNGMSFYDATDTAMNTVVSVDNLRIGTLKLSKVQFLKSEMSSLGANLLHNFDVEIDPVERRFNLFEHNSCDAAPVYWPHSDVAVVPFHREGRDLMTIEVELDGETLEALVDTGAGMSELDDREARNTFDLTPGAAGTEISRSAMAATGTKITEYRHQFKTLEFGGLTITNPWIRIGIHGHSFFNAGLGPPLVIGMSTLAPFHIYIAYDERKLYLTTAHGDIAAGRKPPELSDTGDPLDKLNQRELMESAENAQRAGDPATARRDYDKAVSLSPDDPAPLAARARFLESQHDMAGAEADYARLGSMTLQNAQQYMTRSEGYRRAGQLGRALADADAAVRLAPNEAAPLNERCWTEAIMGRLDAALGDCNAALALAPKSGAILDSRGFVEWKAGKLDAALADYSAAVAANPKSASSLYGRSLVERRKGDTAAADADLAAAKAVRPDVEQQFGS